MSDKLSGAYQNALNRLSTEKGPQIAMVVQTVIVSKNILTEFEQTVEVLAIESWMRKHLIASMREQVSDSVATMCNLIGKGFSKDILPMVQKVTAEATDKKNLQ